MSLTIRQCEERDLPDIWLLYQQLFAGETTTLAEVTAGYQAVCGHPDCAVFVVEQDERVLATFVLYILPNMTHNGRPAAILENIVVAAAQRGQGIGRAMLAYARDRALEHGCYKLSLTSNAKRTGSHEFYRRCGMLQHGVSFRYVL